MNNISRRIIKPEDGYNTIYNRIRGLSKLRYFLKWNTGRIKSKDIDENLMFDDRDLLYIKNLGKNTI